jgi:hypothetical protein
MTIFCSTKENRETCDASKRDPSNLQGVWVGKKVFSLPLLDLFELGMNETISVTIQSGSSPLVCN